jgi:hypothetical protein
MVAVHGDGYGVLRSSGLIIQIPIVKNVAGIGLSGDCDRGAFENVLVYARRWSQALLYLYSANLIILSSYTVFLEEEVRWNEMWSLWC